jgi:hypothetical protein
MTARRAPRAFIALTAYSDASLHHPLHFHHTR